MSDKSDMQISFEEKYSSLKSAFVDRLKANIEAIDNVILQRQLKPFSKDDLERAQMLAHQLSGSGATFGFPEISSKAKEADLLLDNILKNMPDTQSLDDKSFNELEKLFVELKKICSETIESTKYAVAPSQPQKGLSGSDGKPKTQYHVLIVDDDKLLLDLVSTKLRMHGMRVSMARDGTAALDFLSKEIPDLIILDIMMPHIDGQEVLRRLKQNPLYVSIPVIMLTGQTQQQDVVSALHSGAIDYLIKPINLEKLVTRVERILETKLYTIVVVDNDHLILSLLGNKFKEEGYRVILADDGKKGWQEILLNLPDLVILDRMLPGMEGLDILKHMRTEAATREIPAIVLSARGKPQDIENGLKMGAQEYVVKPFVPDDLLALGLKHIRAARR